MPIQSAHTSECCRGMRKDKGRCRNKVADPSFYCYRHKDQAPNPVEETLTRNRSRPRSNSRGREDFPADERLNDPRKIACNIVFAFIAVFQQLVYPDAHIIVLDHPLHRATTRRLAQCNIPKEKIHCPNDGFKHLSLVENLTEHCRNAIWYLQTYFDFITKTYKEVLDSPVVSTIWCDTSAGILTQEPHIRATLQQVNFTKTAYFLITFSCRNPGRGSEGYVLLEDALEQMYDRWNMMMPKELARDPIYCKSLQLCDNVIQSNLRAGTTARIFRTMSYGGVITVVYELKQ